MVSLRWQHTCTFAAASTGNHIEPYPNSGVNLHRVGNALLERGDCCLACTGCENIKAIERTSGTGLDCQPFILLRKGLYSSCNSSLMTNSLCGAYILSFSFFLWDLHRADSNDFLLDALRIHCVFWMLQRKRRQSRKFETFMGEGFVAFGYKILMSFLLLFSLALYNRRWQA